MKQCVHCKEFKNEVEFNFRNKSLGKRWGTCKACQRVQRANWYQKNKKRHVQNVRQRRDKVVAETRQFVWDYLSTHPCVDCGEADPIVLEFDHVRGQKKMILSQLVNSGYGLDVIKEEIAKCEVRCSNCHKRKTAKEQDWFRG